jgi:hypothetical protein
MHRYKMCFTGLNYTRNVILFIWNQMFKFTTFIICNHDVEVKNNYNFRFMSRKINHILLVNIKIKSVVVEWKGATQIQLSVKIMNF